MRRYNPDWRLADPICTFVFSILVLFTTIKILQSALKVLLNAVPDHVDFDNVMEQLLDIEVRALDQH